MMCFFVSWLNFAVPLTAMLLDSVAPDVNTIDLASAPIRAATCYRNKRNKPMSVRIGSDEGKLGRRRQAGLD